MTAEMLAEPNAGSTLSFTDLPLRPDLLESLKKAKYFAPTPIQAALIPRALEGKDVIGQAQTGTGKTASFVLPFLNGWTPDEPAGPQAIVLAPTRELVVQVADEARKLAPSPKCQCLPIYGGQRIRSQLLALKKGAHMVVGSPGRVLDHLSRGTLNLDRVRYVVLDEADRMLDIGFRPDIEKILRRCPKQRQTLLLSATLPTSVLRLAERYMVSPLHINITPEQPTVEKIRQSFYTVDEDRKFELLLRVLVTERPRQCIIFTQRKRTADKLGMKLKTKLPGLAEAMHGDLPQTARDRIMKGFRAGRIAILIATDVVGRGIDVTGISHIINYDLPEDIENYVHRIGRTGRMGKNGVAISFVTQDQGNLLTSIEMAINKLIEEKRFEGFEAYSRRTLPAAEEAKPAAPPTPVFGRTTKRYSNRL